MTPDLFASEYPQGGIPRSEGAAQKGDGPSQSTRSASTESSPPISAASRARVCGGCIHGKHLVGEHQRRLGYVACELTDATKFFSEARECVNGQWRSAPRPMQPAAAVTVAPADAASDAERRWWEATGA